MARPGTFRPGRSGNPGGRRRLDKNVTDLARKYTAEAMMTLVEVMRDLEHPQRVKAAEALLDRGWGRSPMVLAGTGGVGPAELTIRWEGQTEPASS